MATQSTIELNGKVYDAHSGRPVPSFKRPRRVVGSIDGVRRAAGKPPVKQPVVVKPAAPKKPAQTKPHALARAAQRFHGRQQKAVVLNRRAVKKPVKKSSITEVPKATLPQAARTLRAKAIQKSEQISRFGRGSSDQPVKPQPVKAVAAATKAPVKSEARAVNRPAPKAVSKKDALLKEGLDKAQSHHEKSPRAPKKSRKGLLYALLIVAIIAGLGYVGYINIPNIKMKYAATRAGFSAGLPGYVPAGYHLTGPTNFGQGQITIGYQASTDDRSYKITEHKSNWDSESLLSNFVVQKGNVQTSREHGLTIYLYDQTNATWVNNGVWYTIEGNSQLSSQQIIKIAASL